MLGWRVTEEEVYTAIRKTANWKTPGRDHIQNYWYKQFTSSHKQLARCYTFLIENPTEIPAFMCGGVTYLIPKTDKLSKDPGRYRPITCLPTIYKILTAVVADKIYHHLDDNKLLDEEQKGCRKGSRGCKEQLLVDSVVMSSAKRDKRSLYSAYIDYQKAYDSVPHSWLAEILELYKIEGHIIDFLRHAMTMWKTKIIINARSDSIDAGMIEIKRGIFQGDTLSPLWFCLALRPLTSLLNRQKKGYILPQTETQLCHLWYMDDLKLYARNRKYLHDLLSCVTRFSSDIQMKFGLDKCKISCIENGKWTEHTGFEAGRGQGMIAAMQEDERYRYLGYLQARGIDYKAAKETTACTYLQRLRKILKSKLSARNKAKATNTFATSALAYSFGVIAWTETELNHLNISTRKEFRKQRAHHPQSSVERFHIPRSHGGRGIPDIVARHHEQITNLRAYFYKKAETSLLHRAIIMEDKKSTPLKLSDRNFNPQLDIPSIQQKLDSWKSKALHGRYREIIDSELMDTEASTAYLRSGSLFSETEGFIAAIQDQVIPTKLYRKRILGEKLANVRCRMCGEKEESIDHVIAGCSVLAPKAYLDRHNRMGKIVHQSLRKKYLGYNEKVPYYEYEAPPVCEDESYRLYWNRKVITDRPIPSNIPDVILTSKAEKKTLIVDFSVPLASNVSKAYAEKINKYLPLADEIRQMWDMETVTILPIVVGATGEIPKSLIQNLKSLGLTDKLHILMQKSVILDTCSLVRRVLGTY